MVHANDQLTIARAEALFVSDVPAGSRLTRDQARVVIRTAVRRYGGIRGCAAELAARYGEDPETAAPRMRWARAAVLAAYAEALEPDHHRHAVVFARVGVAGVAVRPTSIAA